MIRHITTAALALALAACGGSTSRDAAFSDAPRAEPTPVSAVISSRSARQLFGTEATASAQRPEPFGYYSEGCAAGNVQLAETGSTWQAMRLSRNRNWGQPILIDFLQDLSRVAAAQPGGEGLYIGDLSQPKGGPMLTGHVSHQIGLDADIWLVQPDRLDLSRTERENLSATSFRRSAGAFVNSRWSRAQHEIIKAAAEDPRTDRIFIFPGAKVQMCNDETGDRSWLNKIRPLGGHHYHFHVRLACPPGATACESQRPPPPGDGCAEAQQWVDNILDPPPPDPAAPPPEPRGELMLADLPAQCSGVLAAR
ncbi:Penicillin-insensitive murein endopeptidase precursor [Roseivivax jejudonensis]|uniref:Penicillin-insensitive murein endopeptidase n=1 Tax=Roseivivax jejudonensis TaxID=1529041 RepID=A0A1X6YJV9_9RHOB|nr:penicillin-insensitive murein endopeptidase [Roseivivax jejudonensis]SLN21820.1 Penicillin-insensitive murein endopeptidase precursor [Roseivivax jejudonensis]